MKTTTPRLVAALLGATLVGACSSAALAQDHGRDRALTITRHSAPRHGTGMEYRDGGNEVVAWGGFSANGYGLGNHVGTEAARREARNEAVRLRTDGIYGYGFDGLGGTFDNGDLSNAPGGFGYNNPNYGNAYNGYTGFGGVPTALAFGPAFANRHITDSDDLSNDSDIPGPMPREMGYAAVPANLDPEN